MAAYIVIPVIVLTIMAIYFMVYMYDRRLKTMRASAAPATTTSTCTNVRQEGIVYTISNAPSAGGNGPAARPGSDLNSATHIRIEPDGRGGAGVPPPQYGFTSQNLIVVTTIPRDLPPSYDQVIRTTRDDDAPNRVTAPP